MGERRVQNFYIDPSFDPTKVPKAIRAKTCEIRMMMPFSGQCVAALLAALLRSAGSWRAFILCMVPAAPATAPPPRLWGDPIRQRASLGGGAGGSAGLEAAAAPLPAPESIQLPGLVLLLS